jgi:hypothetical protein
MSKRTTDYTDFTDVVTSSMISELLAVLYVMTRLVGTGDNI